MRDGAFCPVVDQDDKEFGFSGENGDPTWNKSAKCIHKGGERQRTKPFSKTSSKSKRRIDPSAGIIDVIAGCGEGNRHFTQSLEIGPHSAADH